MKRLLVFLMVVAVCGLAGAELLSNPGFEDNGGSIDGWDKWSGGSGSGASVPWWSLGDAAWRNVMQDGTAHSGDTYVEHGIWNDRTDAEMQGTGWNWYWGVSLLFQDHPVVTGDTYTLSAWLRDGWSDPQNPGAGTIPAALTIEQRWDDGSGGRPGEVDLDGDGNNDRINHIVDIAQDGQWHFVTFDHTIPEGVNFVTAVVSTWVWNTNLDVDDASLTPEPTTLALLGLGGLLLRRRRK